MEVATMNIRTCVGSDQTWRAALDRAEAAAATDVPVLLTGASGTGKEVLARVLHEASARCDQPFVPVNVTALPHHLLESELFGHEQGSFTGADRAHAGLFQEADGGTLLIDEIGDLALPLQSKLLRVLQEGEVRPVGRSWAIPIDVRIIAATHRDLPKLVASGQFREDLWYRVSVFKIELPPLRDRGRDVLELARHLLSLHGGPGAPARLSEDAADCLLAHSWPGNVRELENACRHALVLAGRRGPLLREHLPEVVRVGAATRQDRPSSTTLQQARESAELEQILGALESSAGNRTRAAQRLGLSRQALHGLLKRHSIGPAAGRSSLLGEAGPD
jgi:transcriptional regulator with PAS, ATPase and Fis domain